MRIIIMKNPFSLVIYKDEDENEKYPRRDDVKGDEQKKNLIPNPHNSILPTSQ